MKKASWKIMCLFLALTVILGGCSNSGTAEGEAVAVQSVALLAGLDTGLQNRYSGMVVSQDTQEIKRDEEQAVKEIFVEVGQEVTAGQPLFTYDTEQISLAIDQARLELEKLENSIGTMESQIAALEKERKNAASADKLSYTIQIQTLEVDIKQTEYSISTKKVEIERQEKSLENAEVQAKIDGVVQQINEDNSYDNYGNLLPFVTIMQVGNFRIKGTINEMNVMALPAGSPVIIRSRIDSSQTWTGMIESVDTDNPVNDQNNGMMVAYDTGSSDSMTSSTKYPFYITLESGAGLMMGQHVYIELDQGQTGQREGLWLSSYFIVQDGDKAYVWAANDKDRLEKRSIILGELDEELNEYQIAEGLSASDYIAVPSDTLKEGLSVTKYDEASFGGAGEGLINEGEVVNPEGDPEMNGENYGKETPIEGDEIVPDEGEVIPEDGGISPDGLPGEEETRGDV